MRICTNRIIVLSMILGLAIQARPAAAQQPPPPAPPPAEGNVPRVGNAAGRMTPTEAVGLAGCLVPAMPPVPVHEIAGLSPQTPAERLTWDRVDALALVRLRSGRTPLSESLDPRSLDLAARRGGVADFDRFRKEFLAARTPDGSGYVPAAVAFLEVLRRVQVIANGRAHLGRLENISRLFRELIQGESAGIGQLHIDMISDAMERTRGRMTHEIAGYRSALDELKVTLGLSPHAAVYVDQESISAFQRVLQGVDEWNRRPDRTLVELPQLLGSLPALGDVIVSGQPVALNPDPLSDALESLLRDAAGEAIRHGQGDKAAAADDSAAELELRVRRRLRGLIELRRDYDEARRRLELATRLLDQTFERLVSSGETGSSRGPLVETLVTAIGRGPEAQDRLITVWTRFRAERLELYRDLGTLPYSTWDALHADLSAVAVAREPGPAAPAERGPAVPLRRPTTVGPKESPGSPRTTPLPSVPGPNHLP